MQASFARNGILRVALKQVLVPSRWERALILNCALCIVWNDKAAKTPVFFLKESKGHYNKFSFKGVCWTEWV